MYIQEFVVHTIIAAHLEDKFRSKKDPGDVQFCELSVFKSNQLSKSNQLIDNSPIPHYQNQRCSYSVFSFTSVVCMIIRTEVVPYVI